MTLIEQIEKEYVSAYKSRDAVRLTVLRLLKTAVKNRLVALCRPGGTLSDDEMLDVIIKEAKQRQDSIEQYTAAGRLDLAEKEQAELTVLGEYLPTPLTPGEIAALVEAAVHELSACSPRDAGRIISTLMARHKGRIDGKTLAETVKARLA
ncbi:MAG: GatB/YqeY domain-containing protein [Desulfovibrio sp.]|nr:GatB/YqeY domain-containing protein [Desulfovibrio sp.]